MGPDKEKCLFSSLENNIAIFIKKYGDGLTSKFLLS